MINKLKEWWNEIVDHLRERHKKVGDSGCIITLSGIVLFVPGTTGPCSATMIGLQLSGSCSSGTGTGCFQTYMQYQLYELDSNCNPTFFDQGVCMLVVGNQGCGKSFNNIYTCWAFNRPFTGFPNANYKLVMSFYDNNLCQGILIAQKIEYLNYQSGYWSIITKPTGCP